MASATYANREQTDVLLIADSGLRMAVKPGALELQGLQIGPYVAPVPASVTPLQARRALRAAGLLASVEAAIAAAGPDAQDAWQFAQSVLRSDPTLLAVAAKLGLSSAVMDDLFRQAAALG